MTKEGPPEVVHAIVAGVDCNRLTPSCWTDRFPPTLHHRGLSKERKTYCRSHLLRGGVMWLGTYLSLSFCGGGFKSRGICCFRHVLTNNTPPYVEWFLCNAFSHLDPRSSVLHAQAAFHAFCTSTFQCEPYGASELPNVAGSHPRTSVEPALLYPILSP